MRWYDRKGLSRIDPRLVEYVDRAAQQLGLRDTPMWTAASAALKAIKAAAGPATIAITLDARRLAKEPLMATADTRGHRCGVRGPWSAVGDQAENRLHGQKAVMALTMS